MKLLILVVLFSGALIQESIAQSSGFMGKKSALSVGYRVKRKWFYNPDDNFKFNYDREANEFEDSRNILDPGFFATFTHSLTKKVGLSLHFSYDKFKVYHPRLMGNANANVWYNDTLQVNYSIISGTGLNTTSFQIAPGLTFAFGDGVLPLGLQYGLGFIYGRTSFNSENYAIRGLITSSSSQYPEYSEGQIRTLVGDEIGDFSKSLVYYGAYYKLNLIYPINDMLALNLGMYYALNVLSTPDVFSLSNSQGYIVDEEQHYDTVKNRMYINYNSFDIGLTFAF